MDVNQKYTSQLNEQIAKIGKEYRYLEFKSNYQEVDKLGRYISALSNGALIIRILPICILGWMMKRLK